MTKYTPNWNDPRTVKRINSSLDYALANLSPTKPKQWSTRHIDRWFGNQGNPLSKMIRQQLLICTDPYYNPEQGQAKKYLLNLQGAQTLGYKINRQIIPCALHLTQEKISSADRLYGAAIQQGKFEYKLKSSRLWNDIQNLDNATRKPLFENYGYIHEYDIKSAAPTILCQLATQCNPQIEIPTIKAYVADPLYYRQQLAEEIGINIAVAKKLITARFAGGRFGSRNSLFQELNCSWIYHNRLKQSLWFEQISEDLRVLWNQIKISEELGRLTARSKWSVYFREELRVMRSVHRYLDKKSITYFHEHDGWRSTSACDVRELKLHVKKYTDYWLDFV